VHDRNVSDLDSALKILTSNNDNDPALVQNSRLIGRLTANVIIRNRKVLTIPSAKIGATGSSQTVFEEDLVCGKALGGDDRKSVPHVLTHSLMYYKILARSLLTGPMK